MLALCGGARLAIGTEANLEVLLFLLFAFEADGDLLHPSALRKSLLVLGGSLLDLGHSFLHFLILCADRPDEPAAACQNEQG